MWEHWKCNTSSSSAGAQEKGKRGGYETSFAPKSLQNLALLLKKKGKRGGYETSFCTKISAKSSFAPC